MLNKPKLIYCNKHKIKEAPHIQGCLHYNMVQIDIFSEPLKKKYPSEKPSTKKYRLSNKQKNNNLQIFSKNRKFSAPCQLVLTPRTKACAQYPVSG